ncbi:MULTISPECIES: TadE/TadG family type IV pilus assembly protein [unclassified Knoellia]|uniref:TadE/TadG family type IV pilus assembly protein n=1 Tax=Knoellia altitudinis TaxID=3404795 RepID=UPI00360D76E7
MPHHRERGATMVEFALLLPLLLLVLFGLIDMGRMFLTQAMVTNAAREGARMAAFRLDADVPTRANASMPGINGVSGGTTTVQILDACPAAPTAAQAARVRVTVNGFSWVALGAISGLFPGGAIAAPTPTATSSMRCFG